MSEAVDTLEKKHKDGIGEFIKKTRGELDKTTFPSRDEVQKTTIIVVISVIFFAVYLFLVDQALSRLITGLDWVIEKIAAFLGLA